jgi:hypothetical protein
VRHLDELITGWTWQRESVAVQARITRLLEQIDRSTLYRDIAMERADPLPRQHAHDAAPLAQLHASLFRRGWLGAVWRARDELRQLCWSPLADDRRRPLLMFCLFRSGSAGRWLMQMERARRRLSLTVMHDADRQIAALDDELTAWIHLRSLELVGTRSDRWRCPRCKSHYVEEVEFFSNHLRLGCLACHHVEAAQRDHPDGRALETRWRTSNSHRAR